MTLIKISLIVALCAASVFAQQPPKEWIDPDAGHRVFRLTDEPGSHGLKLFRLRQAYDTNFGALNAAFSQPRYIQFGIRIFF